MIKRLLPPLAVLVLAAPLLAAAPLEVVYDGAYRSTALDLALDGSDLWVATSWGIARHDVSSGVAVPVETKPLEGTTSSVVAGDTRIYVGSGSTVFAFPKGGGIEATGSGVSPGTINDLLIIEPYLYAATSSGVVQFDLIDPDNPAAVRTLGTSTGFAQRLAVVGTTLYAADGDATVEVYSIQLPSFPQQIGSFGSLPRTKSVSEAAGRLYLSDGQRTEIWFGTGAQMSLFGSMAAGGNAAHAAGSQIVYLAGDDRRLRAYDVSSASSPVKLFAGDAGAVGGTVNRMLRIVPDGTKLHLAAGDAGLQTWETAGFAAPYLLRGYEAGGMSSIAAFSGGAAAARVESGLIRYAVGSGGELSGETLWDSENTSVVFDATESSLLVASGVRLRLIDLQQTPPVDSGSVSMSTAIRSAVIVNGGAVAVLANQTVWSVDFSAGTATQADLGSVQPLFVASGGGDLAFAEFNEDGTTTVIFYTGGNLAGSPVTAVVDGAASSGISLSSSRVACFTFRGISLVDFAGGGEVTVFPSSNIGIARDIELSGTNVFLLTSSRLQVWDTVSQALSREVPIEGGAVAVAHAEGESSALVAAADGLSAIQFETGSEPPDLKGVAGGMNRYFREAVFGGSSLHLFDGRDVVSLPLDSTGLPGPGRGLSPEAAPIDTAAIGDDIFFLTPTGEVSAYSPDGVKVSTYQVDESGDQRILSMLSVAGALWVSVEVNCLSGGCEFRTIILDPSNGLVKTSTLSGSAVAATAEASTIWGAFDDPAEIRIYDASDPFRPTAITQAASTGDPIAIAHDSEREAIYVIGDRLYIYRDSNLQFLGELLEPYESDPTGRVGYIDQLVQVIDDCAVITGRTFDPMVYTITSPVTWIPALVPGSRGAAVRSSGRREGLLYILSDYALEIWSVEGNPSPRRRPARRNE